MITVSLYNLQTKASFTLNNEISTFPELIHVKLIKTPAGKLADRNLIRSTYRILFTNMEIIQTVLQFPTSKEKCDRADRGEVPNSKASKC